MNVIIQNTGSALQPSSVLNLKSTQIDIPGVKSFSTPEIAPFGHLEYNFDLRTHSLFASFDDTISLTVGDKEVSQKVAVRPFFTFRLFPLMVILTAAVIAFIYLGVLGIHLYHHRSHYFKKKTAKKK